MSKRTDPVEVRFWAKVDKGGPDDCWLWTAAMLPTGYGQVRVNKRTWRAHRFAYELLVGPIPDGLHIDHLCRNRRCVNPAHLEVVTQAENNRRAATVRSRPTKCPHGHVYDEHNTWTQKDGRRRCKRCQADRAARYWRRKVAA